MGEVWRTLLSLAVIVLAPLGAGAQSGETIPRVDSLRLLGANAIVDALTSGAMRLQGEALTGAQKVHVAEYIAGAPVSERVARPLSQRLVGSWRLISAEGRSTDGTVTLDWGPEPVGRLILNEGGRTSVHLLNPDRTPSLGSYTVDEGVGAVTFHVEGAAVPNHIGTAQRRFVLLEGDQLTLRTPPARAGAADVTYDIIWERER